MARNGRSEGLQEIDLDDLFVRGPASSQVGRRGRQIDADEVLQMLDEDFSDDDYEDESVDGRSSKRK
jgi:hypothetical protein